MTKQEREEARTFELNTLLVGMQLGLIFAATYGDFLLRSPSADRIKAKTKRQQEGIVSMKERGEWDKYGRPRKMSTEDFTKAYQRVIDGEIGSLALMRELGLQRATYWRYVREFKTRNPVPEK